MLFLRNPIKVWNCIHIECCIYRFLWSPLATRSLDRGAQHLIVTENERYFAFKKVWKDKKTYKTYILTQAP